MKSKLNSLTITAVGLTLSAVAAYGQNNVTANVPFSFRTAAGVQAAGHYAIVPANPEASVMQIRNMDSGASTLLGLGTRDGDRDTRPRLVFHCGSDSGCVLAGVWMSDGRGWSYKTPKLKASEQERVAVVYLNNKQAE